LEYLKMTTETNHALEQAQAQASSIVAMVGALECDYDRLEELRDERKALADDLEVECTGEDITQSLPEDHPAIAARDALEEWELENAEELAELEEAANGCADQEEAQQAINDDPLSIEVRSSWQTIGETLTPSEFCVLLCTGGPAVRIVGELDENLQPCRAWIEYQDWGTPWTHLVNCPASQDTLLTYCQQFFFGE
jgi:hypothetical protein